MFLPKDFKVDPTRYVGKSHTIALGEGIQDGSLSWEFQRNGDLKMEAAAPNVNVMGQKLMEQYGAEFKRAGLPDKCGQCDYCAACSTDRTKSGTIFCVHPRSVDGQGRPLAVDPDLPPLHNSLRCPLADEAVSKMRSYFDLGSKGNARKRGQEVWAPKGVTGVRRG